MSLSVSAVGIRKLLVPLVVILAILLVKPAISSSFELLLGTDDTDSFSYFAGKAVCRAINKAEGNLSCRAVPSSNYTDNLTNVQSGSLDMALVNSRMIYDAYHAAGLFKYVSLDYTQLRLLMPLYRTPVSLVANHNSDITSLESLEGKRVNCGAPFSLQEIVFNELMKAQGWRENDFTLLQKLPTTNSQDFIALHNGSVQALLHIDMHPDRRLELGMSDGRTSIVGIDSPFTQELIDSSSGFYRQRIPAWTYAGQAEDIDTLSLETLLITSADIDNETVEQILTAISSSSRRLKNAHPAFLEHGVDVETLNRSYLHPHPEALLFFQVYQKLF